MADEETQNRDNEALDEESDEETERAMQEMIAAAEANEAAEQEALKASQQSGETANPPEGRSPTGPDGDKSEKGLNRILSMRVPVIVKLAEKPMTLSTVLKFNLGSVISFDKDAYQLVDLMVNNSTIGLGQTVKIGENFGLRITQIGQVEETIKSLGQTSAAE